MYHSTTQSITIWLLAQDIAPLRWSRYSATGDTKLSYYTLKKIKMQILKASKQKYPLLKSLELVKHIMQSEKGRVAQAGYVLKRKTRL